MLFKKTNKNYKKLQKYLTVHACTPHPLYDRAQRRLTFIKHGRVVFSVFPRVKKQTHNFF